MLHLPNFKLSLGLGSISLTLRLLEFSVIQTKTKENQGYHVLKVYRDIYLRGPNMFVSI
jgi:hypothetical protein